jgi:ABC-type uncharacterized transport system involved in gliding motility auxiliary subunit
MDFLKKYLNWAAGLLILAALAARMVWPYRKSLALVLGAAGLLALVAYVLLHLDELKQGFRRRSFIYSGNMVLVVVLVLAILVLVNYFLARHSVMVDLTAGKIHSLSGQTLTVLKALKADVSLKAFFRESNYGRGAMESLLKLYAYHSPRIKYEFIDPDKNPSLVKQYGITQDGTTVLEAGGQEGRVTSTSEEDLTNALIKATRAQKKVIYFLEGHGEGTIEESGDDGYSTAKSELEKLGYEVKKLTLALADRFPADCALLVVPGPQKDLLSNEYETIRSYVKGGGRALALVDPETPTLLPIFLSDFGFKLENDIIVDRVARLLGGDYFIPVVTEYEPHAITNKFDFATLFPLVRSIDVTTPAPEGATLTVLAKTSENSYAKVDFLLKPQMTLKDIAFVEGKDRRGPIPIAVAGSYKFPAKPAPEAPPAEAKPGEKTPAAPEGQAESKPEPKTEAAEKEARMAVVGDSDFFKNRYYGLSGNGNFFLNIVNWLTEESDLIAIQPKTQAPRTLELSPVRMSLLRLVVLYLLPFGVLALGVFIWIRRKSL